jgi:hypothetical protein
MTASEPPPLIARNGFDEWALRRDLSNTTLADELGCSPEAVRRLRLPFGHPNRNEPSPRTLEKILRYTRGEIGRDAFTPPHLRGGALSAGA